MVLSSQYNVGHDPPEDTTTALSRSPSSLSSTQTATHNTNNNNLSSLTSASAASASSTIDLTSEDKKLPPITSIWQDEYCNPCAVQTKEGTTKEGWECTRCGCKFTPKHATRALYHQAKVTNMGIAVCKAIIPASYAARYKLLLEELRNKSSNRKRANVEVESYVEDMQNGAVTSLVQKKNRKHPVTNNLGHSLGYAAVSGSSGTNNTSNSLGFEVVGRSSSRSRVGDMTNQPSIDAAMEVLTYSQQDIRATNNARLEMAIADFFHCCNVPDSVVEDPRFNRIIQLARCVGSDFKIPNRKKIGGDLLNLNYKNTFSKNKTAIMSQAL